LVNVSHFIFHLNCHPCYCVFLETLGNNEQWCYRFFRNQKFPISLWSLLLAKDTCQRPLVGLPAKTNSPTKPGNNRIYWKPKSETVARFWVRCYIVIDSYPFFMSQWWN
jgi:hypothetical protein